ncbi:SH3 domain-containing protein [Streptomyces sp. NPDC049879]|uniref:SH3 domain-containing protein n=1 Tax=Streptomyces sp. NPDC049879 TaxID=3365598 RepID=UPI0037A78394
MKSLRTKLTALALPLALAATALITAPTASAAETGAAAYCPQPAHQNKDSDFSWIWSSLGSAPLRSGPSSDCPTVVNVYPDTKFFFHCYWVNKYGNAWTFVRIEGTQIYGWMYEGNIGWGGSAEPCD